MKVVIVGVGGLGSHVVQQLAYLGFGNLFLIDHDLVETSNLNRLVTATKEDVGKCKVNVLKDFVLKLDPSIAVTAINKELRSPEAFANIRGADLIIGCLDHDGPRFLLTLFSAAYEIPYLDLASEIGQDQASFGGRVAFSHPGKGCLSCMSLLSSPEIREWTDSPADKKFHDTVYGQMKLEGSGPSVVSINGVVSSLAITELLLEIAHIRDAKTQFLYRGPFCKITEPEENKPKPQSCYICSTVRGKRSREDFERFLR